MYEYADKAEMIQIAHGEKDGEAFCKKVEIDSARNLEIYLKKLGVWDGHEWTYGELSKEYGFSRPRAVQICQRTEKHLKRYYDEKAE